MERFPAALFAATLALIALAGCTDPGSQDDARTVPCPSDLAAVPHDEMVHIDMDGMAYHPAQANAAAGQVVMWINSEGVGHTVTPNDDGDPWRGDPEGSGNSPDRFMQEGDTWLWCFERPGNHTYHCIPHAARTGEGYKGMVGTVTVG